MELPASVWTSRPGAYFPLRNKRDGEGRCPDSSAGNDDYRPAQPRAMKPVGARSPVLHVIGSANRGGPHPVSAFATTPEKGQRSGNDHPCIRAVPSPTSYSRGRVICAHSTSPDMCSPHGNGCQIHPRTMASVVRSAPIAANRTLISVTSCLVIRCVGRLRKTSCSSPALSAE
jgi:hypothetical protein